MPTPSAPWHWPLCTAFELWPSDPSTPPLARLFSDPATVTLMDASRFQHAAFAKVMVGNMTAFIPTINFSHSRLCPIRRLLPVTDTTGPSQTMGNCPFNVPWPTQASNHSSPDAGLPSVKCQRAQCPPFDYPSAPLPP